MTYTMTSLRTCPNPGRSSGPFSKLLRGWAPLLCITVSGCAAGTAPVSQSAATATAVAHHPPRAGRATPLQQREAEIRAQQVYRINTRLWFGFDGSDDDYDGRAVLHFDLRPGADQASPELFIDFDGGQVQSLRINGFPVAEPRTRHDGSRIRLQVSELLPHSNKVEITFTHPYSHNGNGLHRFEDPVDHEAYLYSDFEPYNARRMFPCFDQPDLKSTYELTVETPENWQVIANTEEREVATVDGHKSWQFPPSPLFSTYVFALHAGPYASWSSNAQGIPIRLFARQSLAQWVDSAEWLDVTRKGLQFFHEKFGVHYPFAKYDQILVPDFNEGAMENVGAVTFNEDMVFRSKVTEDVRRRRADTILHEMAHMWFGNLVTMRWWNGLWLNESFATFMAAWATDQTTRFRDSWQGFFGQKQGAYWADQLVTTHPIEGEVADTDAAFANFDSITYGKGAAVLKQLRFWVGDAAFLKGLNQYFTDHAFKNTTLADFIAALAKSSGQDLARWQKLWLQTAGVNTVEARWECTDSRLSRLTLVQGGDSTNPLRPHRTQVALYTGSRAQLKRSALIPVAYEGAETEVPEAKGKACPALVYPNHDDQDYVKVVLDPVSLKSATQSLSKLQDPFARQMLWFTLWEMVRDGKLAAPDYLALVETHLPAEKEFPVLRGVIRAITGRALTDSSALRYLTPSELPQAMLRVEALLHQMRGRAKAGSDLQLTLHKAWLRVASSPAAVKEAQELLDGKRKIAGLKIEQDRRWELVHLLALNGAPDASVRIAEEKKRDGTDLGIHAAIAAEAAIPKAESKEQWLKTVLRKGLRLSQLRDAMGSYHHLGQEALSEPAAQAFWQELPALAKCEEAEFTTAFAHAMYPGFCDADTVTRTTRLIDSANLPFAVTKALREGRQEVERCIRNRAVPRTPASAPVRG